MKQLLTAVARLFEDDENVHKKCRDNVLKGAKTVRRMRFGAPLALAEAARIRFCVVRECARAPNLNSPMSSRTENEYDENRIFHNRKLGMAGDK